jgi:hypothetical protein
VNRLPFPILFVLIVTIACASRPAGPPRSPYVTITQLSQVAPLRVSLDGGLPVQYRLEVTNPFDHPVTLTSVEVETVGDSGAYAMKRVRHAFTRNIAAHAVDTVDFRAWVQTLSQSEMGEVRNPVMVRGTARFQSVAGVMQTTFSGRVQ